MALFEESLSESLGGGLLVGLGALILGPIVIPMAGRVLRPVVKAAVKAGLTAYEAGREVVNEAAENVRDLAAESKAEMADAASGAMEPGGGRERSKRTPPSSPQS